MINKLKALFSKKQPDGSYKKIVGIRGELTPGFISVDIEEFEADGSVKDQPTETKVVKITPKMRPTCNRILAGLESEADLEVFNLFILG